jgi:quercetin dioxygenase-like cupin family protein
MQNWKKLFVSAGLATLVAAPGAAFAGSCPADKSGPDIRPLNSTPAAAVTDQVIGAVDLAKEPNARADNRILRLRKLVVQPGGVVPWHTHGNRPAIIYIISGEIEEYASTCSVPIVHKPGDVATEHFGTAHWWKNTGKETVLLLSADFFPVQDEHPHTM